MRIFTISSSREPPYSIRSVRECPINSSGDPNFHAQASSGPPFFTLPRHIPTKMWGECSTPPPPDTTPSLNLMMISKYEYNYAEYNVRVNPHSTKLCEPTCITCILTVLTYHTIYIPMLTFQ